MKSGWFGTGDGDDHCRYGEQCFVFATNFRYSRRTPPENGSGALLGAQCNETVSVGFPLSLARPLACVSSECI